MKKILYSLLFIYSSLSSLYANVCVDVNGTGYTLGTLQVFQTSIGKVFNCSPDSFLDYPYNDTQVYTCSSFSGPDAQGNYTLYDYKVYDKGSQCALPSVCPDNDTVLPVPESDCQGSFTWVNDGAGTVYSELYWQSCDNTCRGVVLSFLNCDQLGQKLSNACDKSQNNFNFVCNETSDGMGLADMDKTYCRHKTNPCDAEFDRIQSTCGINQTIIGYEQCTHNGLTVTNHSIKCVDNNSSENPANQKPWDCESYFHQTWDSASNTCNCESGYFRNNYGSCEKSLDANASQAEKDSAADKAAQDAKDKKKMENDFNNSRASNQHLQNIDNGISTLAREVNTTNSLLSDLSSKFDSNGSTAIPSFNPTTDFNDLKGQYSSIQTSIDDVKNLLSNGLVNTIPSGSGGSCAYTGSITGNGMTIPVSFDPCQVVQPYYTTLYNIWYFLFFALFFVFSVKVLLMSKGD